MIYTVGGIKGGSGKTTVATNLVVFLSLQGRRVLLVDADDQESATDFTASRNEQTQDQAGYTAVRLSENAVRVQVKQMSEVYDDIVIDTGGRDTISQRAAMSVSDVYLVPFVPGGYDLWTIDQVEALIAEVKTINPDLKAYTFINRGDHEGHYNEDVSEALKDSEELGFIDAPLGNRKVYRHSTIEGKAIVEYTPRDRKAVDEIETLFSHFTEREKQTL
ncbi:MAG: AAA family ATPase [Anaerolineae bacterium]|nr:AAA family ATPase [Anaerolineae bacterium]